MFSDLSVNRLSLLTEDLSGSFSVGPKRPRAIVRAVVEFFDPSEFLRERVYVEVVNEE